MGVYLETACDSQTSARLPLTWPWRAGRNRQEMMRAVGAARARHRSDVEQGRQAEADVVETTEYLEHASHLAMASLLRVSRLFCCFFYCKPPGGAIPACRWSCA